MLVRDFVKFLSHAFQQDKLYLWMGKDIGETLRLSVQHVAGQYASFLLSRESLKKREEEREKAKKTNEVFVKREVAEFQEGSEPADFVRHFKDWTLIHICRSLRGADEGAGPA